MLSATDEPNARILSQQINIATRSVHTKLNKLIIHRLPLALPPVADDGSHYVSGLLHVAPIYIAFESLWAKIVEAPPTPSPEPDTFGSGCTEGTHDTKSQDLHTLPEVLEATNAAAVSSRVRTILTQLSFPEMRRTQALQDDLLSLTGWSSCTLAKHLNDAAESPILSSFLNHIRHAIKTRPHVLLAYGWVLYMALFSGGRFIRASLEAAGPAFWVPPYASTPASETEDAEQTAATVSPLQFFRFNTPDDGENLKHMYKASMVELEALLSDQERDDIVEEAQNIFDFMMKMVMELDDICGTSEGSGSRLLSLRSRDSVVVEKERRSHLAQLAMKVGQEDSTEPTGKPSDGRKGWLRFLQ